MPMFHQLKRQARAQVVLLQFRVAQTYFQTLANLTDNNKYVSPAGNPLS